MALDPLNVDTSLEGNSSLVEPMAAGVAGIDTPAPGWLDADVLFPTPSPDDFAQAMDGQPVKFSTVPQASSGKGSVRDQMVSTAKGYLGMMYDWGGNGKNGRSFDCSGFIQAVYGKYGVQLPRVSYQQAAAGQRVSRDQAIAGDVIAWDNSSRNNGADHVALYLGNGKIMEFYGTGHPSRIRSLGKKENYTVTRIKLPGE